MAISNGRRWQYQMLDKIDEMINNKMSKVDKVKDYCHRSFHRSGY
jgi:hypothetical protein